jgi:hypothetical protein
VTPEERLDVRWANETLKLSANLLNALAGASIVIGILTPLLGRGRIDPWLFVFSLGFAAIFYLGAVAVLYDLKSEG